MCLTDDELMKLTDCSFDMFALSERGNDRFIAVNKKASEILGYTEEELLSRPFFDFVVPEDVEKTKREGQKLEEIGGVHSFINRYKTKEGNIVYLRWNSSEIQGKFYNFARLEEDIEDLNLSRDNFSQLFDNTGTVICIADLEGHIIDVSPSGQFFWGYSKKELLNMTVFEITHPHDVSVAKNFFSSISDKNRKKDHYQIKKRYLHKNGYIVFGIVDCVVMWDINKGPAYIVKQIQDVTNLVKAEKEIDLINKQLLVKNKNLESFAYAASHDLQEPLRKISAFSSIIKRKMEEKCSLCFAKDNIFDDLDSLVSASKRMGRLIDDLLEYSRVGRFDYDLEPVDLNEIFEDVKDLLQISIEEKKVIFEKKDLPTVCANKTRIIQLFQNLIGNSIKFSKKDKSPLIKIYVVKKEENKITLCIEDNGVGFSMEFAEKIFRPFERLYGREDYDGSGMGLALCKSIVDNLGGEIWAESELDQGSRFYVTLKDEGCGSYGI